MRRWMLFVDGENLAIEGEKVAKQRDFDLERGSRFHPAVYLWPGSRTALTRNFSFGNRYLEPDGLALRAFYYTSLVGSADDRLKASDALWKIGFNPRVFARDKNTKRSKGVDIALATEMLSKAFLNNYDIALLVAGDGDYKPLVDEVKHLGKLVYLCGSKTHRSVATCDWHVTP